MNIDWFIEDKMYWPSFDLCRFVVIGPIHYQLWARVQRTVGPVGGPLTMVRFLFIGPTLCMREIRNQANVGPIVLCLLGNDVAYVTPSYVVDHSPSVGQARHFRSWPRG